MVWEVGTLLVWPDSCFGPHDAGEQFRGGPHPCGQQHRAMAPWAMPTYTCRSATLSRRETAVLWGMCHLSDARELWYLGCGHIILAVS